MKYFFRALLPLLMCVALGGCNSPEPRLAHVKLQTVNHMVTFNTGTVRLSSYQIDHLKHFVATLPAPAVSYLAISANPSDPRAAQRRSVMKQYLIHEGIDTNVIHVTPAFIPMDRQSLLLTVQYSKAVPPAGCPDWSKDSLANYNNTDMSGFGCAYNTNLAVQVADPADLYGGHATPEFDAARDSVAIQKYIGGASAPAAAATSASGSGGASASAAPSP